MNSDRVYKVQDRAKHTMFSIYSSAKSYKSTAAEIRGRVLELKESLPKGTPYYVKSFLYGMEEVLQADLYRYCFEFCYTVDGKLYSTCKKSDRYYEKHDITPSQLQARSTANGHYWTDTDKPYFETLKD